MIITGGKYKGRKVLAPEEKITRPTLSKVRMGVFNTLFSIMGDFEGKTFLDVFGGSGIMGLEALSRGFKEVVVFEKNPKVAQIIKKNYETLGLKANLMIGDSLKLLRKLDKEFDVIYVDPPYMSGVYEEVFDYIYKYHCNNEFHASPLVGEAELSSDEGWNQYLAFHPSSANSGSFSHKGRIVNCVIIAEHSEDINIKDFELIKEKNYGGKRVSFFAV